MSDDFGDRVFRHYLVSGRVQGVGFRHFTRVQAQELGLVGTVKNLDDGRVEIHVAGDPAILDDFEDRVRQGPRTGRVDDLEREDLDPDQVRDDDRWQDFRVVR